MIIQIGQHEIAPGEKFVTVYKPLSGWKYVVMWHNPEMDGFLEPWEVATRPCGSEMEAIIDAMTLANNEGIPYIPRQQSDRAIN